MSIKESIIQNYISSINWKRDDWNGLESAEFNQIFKHSAIKRAGFAKLKENIGFLNEKKSETS